MSYKSLTSYKRLDSDTRYVVKKAGAEVKVKVEIFSVVGRQKFRTVEIGTGFASPIGVSEAERRAKRDALDDAVTKHISTREDDLGPSGTIDGSGISTRPATIRRYGITKIRILDSWVRHRVPTGHTVRVEGRRVVWRNAKGRYVTWNRASEDSDITRDLGELGYEKAFDEE